MARFLLRRRRPSGLNRRLNAHHLAKRDPADSARVPRLRLMRDSRCKKVQEASVGGFLKGVNEVTQAVG